MDMGGRMATPTDAQILTLAQWLSPAFPIGAFAYCHGLEATVAMGWVTDADSFEPGCAMFSTVARDGRMRCFWRRRSMRRTPMALAEIDAAARAFAASAERLLETQAQGAAFGKLTNAVWDMPLDALTYPVALGAAARPKSCRWR